MSTEKNHRLIVRSSESSRAEGNTLAAACKMPDLLCPGKTFTRLSRGFAACGRLLDKKVIMAIFMVTLPLLAGACTKEEGPEIEKPRVVVSIKRTVGKAPNTLAAKDETKQESSNKKTVGLEQKPTGLQSTEEGSKKQPSVVGEGLYRVRKADTLFKIAGLQDVYGDSIKWPSLFRLNLDELGRLKVADKFQLQWSSIFQLSGDRLGELKVVKDFQHEELPEGLGLRFLTLKEVQQNLVKIGHMDWVINVLSSQSSQELVPFAVKLMKEGYRVYLARATVKGAEWMRLRVGFFENRSDAASAGKKIISLLNSNEIWVTRIGKEELEQFGGY
ncbi:MAG TPA: SPOR domain-containing protein [Acidobacteriota bacterium]|nr:SPOR domain-containing protein [Acidobacteriota bacterium]